MDVTTFQSVVGSKIVFDLLERLHKRMTSKLFFQEFPRRRVLEIKIERNIKCNLVFLEPSEDSSLVSIFRLCQKLIQCFYNFRKKQIASEFKCEKINKHVALSFVPLSTPTNLLRTAKKSSRVPVQMTIRMSIFIKL